MSNIKEKHMTEMLLKITRNLAWNGGMDEVSERDTYIPSNDSPLNS